jgi:hypothetical protein
VKFVATKNGLTKFFFHPCLLLLFLDPGSGMGKNQDPGSGINIPDPPHWFKKKPRVFPNPDSNAHAFLGASGEVSPSSLASSLVHYL